MTLQLIKMGMDHQLTDVGNYRVRTVGNSVRGKDGQMWFLEFTCHDRYHYRTTNKRTGEPLKRPVHEVAQRHTLHVDSEVDEGHGYCHRNMAYECIVNNLHLDCTLSNILVAVNLLSADLYDGIEFVER